MKKMSRAALVGAAAVSSVVLVSAPAFAHVSVQPEGTAAKGGYAVVDFKVPNERDDAATTKLEVSFPTDHPLASVMPQPIPGWKAEVTKSKLDKPLEMHGEKITEAVSKVTWTATGSGDAKGVQPGYFQKFPLSIGQLPTDTDQLVFKAIQTYDNKEVVRWIEPQQKGQEEPENPAPTLELSAAEGDEHGASGAASDDKKEAAAASSDTSAADSGSSDSDTTARVLGIVGIVVGIAGVAFGVLAGRRRTNS
ncbi:MULTISPECIES: YcnI family copper-binding membrane protein [Streptomyces]|uniref:YcnI family copper-binding membrane protein n=1 Tax=Streptomyces TaxID=1883 RepID=UPI00210A0D69|nr:YcnI family protein [Streptomyces longispororuber]MCQ4211597.1 YcnI family protein [Streptomyces longispororuber]